MSHTYAPKLVVLAAVLAIVGACEEEDEIVPLPQASTSHPAPWDPDTAYESGLDVASLSPDVTNTLFPAPVGAQWVYEGHTEDGMERTEISVLEETKDVFGTTARVVRDTVYLEGELIEDTWDWYAQDADGNVWYLGEETYEYENGEKKCDCGSWESGVDGAQPGIVMLAAPKVGDAYRQEYYVNEAEDLAEIVELGVSITVAAGSFSDCIKTRDLSAIERDVEEFKTYCPGVGVVFEEAPADDETTELVEYTPPPG
jgi:hypothetical protein